MKKETLKFDAEYASQVLNSVPKGYVDKTICGCGLTTVALENYENIIIAVPTIYLAVNKTIQYPNKRFSGKILAVWGKTKQSEIDNYLKEAGVVKIMVTYDSLSKVEYLLNDCRLIIDESNELLSNTKLKPDVIDNVFRIAEKYKDSVSFISATPTPLQYMPNWLSNINQVKIEWNNTIKSTPILCERTFPFKSLKEEILKPLKDKGTLTIANKIFKKVIVFINSVDQITKVIKDVELDKNDCGIICGNSLKNDIKIRGINRYDSGILPKYLFITSSGFCGIDLNDKDAMPIVVSNISKEWQMIDILTDLKQAISRQRNKKNPNYGSYIYIYNQNIFSKSKEELITRLNNIYEKIQIGIRTHKELKERGEEKGFMIDSDFKNYTFYKDGYYILNEQAFKADEYFILEIREQYSKGFDIKGALDNVGDIIEIKPVELPKNTTYIDLVDYFREYNNNGIIDWGNFSSKTDWITIIESSYKLYKNVWKDMTYAKKMIENYGDDFELLKLTISKMFNTGKRYTRKEVKEKLQILYDSNNIKRKAKHSDLYEIFREIKDVTVTGVRMIEIIKK